MDPVSFVRKYRIIAQINGETIAAIKLARINSWEQLFTDGTSRRQVSFQNLIIGLLDDDDNDDLNPLIVSSCIFVENETAEKQVEGILEKVSDSYDIVTNNKSNWILCCSRLIY